MLNCSNEYPKSEALYKDLSKNQYPDVIILLSIVCVLCVIMLIMYIEAVIFIYRFYGNNRQKIRFMFLLAIYPIVGWTSLLTLLVPTSTLLNEFIASIYLSVCIVIFLNMLIEYFGGTTKLLQVMSEEDLSFATGPLCCCCMCIKGCHRPFNKRHLSIASAFALQIAVIRPIVLYIASVLWTDGKYNPGEEGQEASITFIISIVSSVSTITGMWGLQIVYRSTRVKLPMFRIGMKFVSLQLAIICMNLQRFIISILSQNDIPGCDGGRGPLLRGSRLNHYLLTVEMFLISILARFAFRRQEGKTLHDYPMVEQAMTNTSDKEVNGKDNFVDVATIS